MGVINYLELYIFHFNVLAIGSSLKKSPSYSKSVGVLDFKNSNAYDRLIISLGNNVPTPHIGLTLYHLKNKA